jgi:hypothetical protein
MAIKDSANVAASETIDRAQEALEGVTQTLKDSYQAAQKLVEDSDLGSRLGDFVEREPWIAIAAAFAIGYVGARILKRIS